MNLLERAEYVHVIRTVVSPGEGFLELPEMVIEDIYIEHAEPHTGVMVGDRWMVTTAALLPVRSWDNPDDWYIDIEGERHLKKNLMIPILATAGTKVHLYGAGKIIVHGLQRKKT